MQDCEYKIYKHVLRLDHLLLFVRAKNNVGVTVVELSILVLWPVSHLCREEAAAAVCTAIIDSWPKLCNSHLELNDAPDLNPHFLPSSLPCGLSLSCIFLHLQDENVYNMLSVRTISCARASYLLLGVGSEQGEVAVLPVILLGFYETSHRKFN